MEHNIFSRFHLFWHQMEKAKRGLEKIGRLTQTCD